MARLVTCKRQSHALGDVVMASDDAGIVAPVVTTCCIVLRCWGWIARLIVQHGVIGKTSWRGLRASSYVLLESNFTCRRRAELRPAHRSPSDDGETGDRIAGGQTQHCSRPRAHACDDGLMVASMTPTWVSACRPANRCRDASRTARCHHPSGADPPRADAGACRARPQRRAKPRSRCGIVVPAGSTASGHDGVFNAPEFSDRSQFRLRSMRCCVGLLQGRLWRIPCT